MMSDYADYDSYREDDETTSYTAYTQDTRDSKPVYLQKPRNAHWKTREARENAADIREDEESQYDELSVASREFPQYQPEKEEPVDAKKLLRTISAVSMASAAAATNAVSQMIEGKGGDEEDDDDASQASGWVGGFRARTQSYFDKVNELYEDREYSSDLTVKQRIMGCVSCIALGYLLSIGSVFRYSAAWRGNPLPFIFTATLGNVVAMAGSCFLAGPSAQLENMISKKRILISFVYLGSIGLTFMYAIHVAATNANYRTAGQKRFLLAFMVLQYLSMALYCLSYVPLIDEIMEVLWIRIKKRTGGCRKLLRRRRRSRDYDDESDDGDEYF